MTRIGLLSDTHSYLDEKIFHHFANVDEIWHAGDVGNIEVYEKLAAFKPIKGVYGNIDDSLMMQYFPRILEFTCEEVRVLITHIGGYPPKYNPQSLPLIQSYRPFFGCIPFRSFVRMNRLDEMMNSRLMLLKNFQRVV
ncbi:MAG: hypothetical protein FYV88_3240, partial [Bacteroidetes bacterium]|nr:hypothetical protein [Bacteroidota bacterium]